MAEISTNFNKVEERLDNLINAVNAAVQTFPPWWATS